MRIVLVLIVLVAACAVAGYLGLPILIEKETSGLKSDVNDLKQRLLKIEEVIKREEEARKVGQLSSDADVQKIIKTVNAIFPKVTSLEEALKSQAETLDKSAKESQSKIQRMTFDASMASIRGHLLKVQIELKVKNIGTAKTEIDLINEILEKTKTQASDPHKKTIEELQSALNNAKAEMDSNLPAAINRIDLLWHEVGKLIRKS